MHSEVRKNSDALAGLPPPLTAERRISADVDMDPCKAGKATKRSKASEYQIKKRFPSVLLFVLFATNFDRLPPHLRNIFRRYRSSHVELRAGQEHDAGRTLPREAAEQVTG